MYNCNFLIYKSNIKNLISFTVDHTPYIDTGITHAI